MFITLHLSGSIHHMIVIFGALYKMMTSLGAFFFFFFFKVLIFQTVRGVKGRKMAQNDKKNMFVSLCISGTVPHCGFCVKWYLWQFFRFFKILIFLVFKGVEGQKITHNYQYQSVTLYISRTVDHIIKIFRAQMQNNDISKCFSLFFKKY